jgi:lipopolysaccharide export system protein LptA
MRALTLSGVLALLLTGPAMAQAPVPPAPGVGGLLDPRQSGGNQPTEITARDGIEWDRTRQRYIARGDAQVTRGDSVIQADTLMALYRPAQPPPPGQPTPPDGATERTTIYRYEAIGGVRVTTPTQTIVADRAVYDVAAGRIILTGQNLRLSTPNETVTARDSLEYHEVERRAVARGDATVVTSDQRWLRADVLTAYMYAPNEPRPPASQRRRASRANGAAPTPLAGGGNQSLKRAVLEGNVVIVTQTDTVRGARADYNNHAGTAEVTGGAQITRGQNHLTGDRVEVNLETGLGRLLPGSDGRVRALVVPNQGAATPVTPQRPPAR